MNFEDESWEWTGVASESDHQKDEYKIVVDRDIVTDSNNNATVWYHAYLTVGVAWNTYQTIMFESSKHDPANTLASMVELRNKLNDAIDHLDSI